MRISELVTRLNGLFPMDLQESYDNSGGQIVFNDEGITGILLALDVSDAVLDEADELKCNCLITHHPFIFKAMKRIDSRDPQGAMVIRCIERRITLFAAHTNLDRLFSGRLNDVLGFRNMEPLMKKDDAGSGKSSGFGSLSLIEPPMSLRDLLAHVRTSLGTGFCLYTGSPEKKISRVALLNGAGGGSVEKIISTRDVQCIITGDVSYHNAAFARMHDVALIDAGHYGTERVFLKILGEAIRDCLTNTPDNSHVPYYISNREENPVRVFI
jgi:dinuclear metal center YbgI/SA1388 family protein